MSVDNSEVILYGGEYSGGAGGASIDDPTMFAGGGHGALVMSGSLLACGATLRAGAGTVTNFFDPLGFLPGGNGALIDPGALFRNLDSELVAGPGAKGLFPGSMGAPGLPLVNRGTNENLPGPHRGLITDNVVFVGEELEQTYFGEPGELAIRVLGFGLSPVPAFLPELAGHSLLCAPVFVRVQGTLDSNGQLFRSTTIPDFGLQGLAAYFQTAFFDGSAVLLGNTAAVALVDGALVP